MMSVRWKPQFRMLCAGAMVGAAVLFGSPAAKAAVLTYNFSGVVNSVSWSLGGASGDTFSGSFTFNSEPVVSGNQLNYFSGFSITLAFSPTPLVLNGGAADAFLSDGAFDSIQIYDDSFSGVSATASVVFSGGTTGYDATNAQSPLNLAGFSSRSIVLRDSAFNELFGTVTALTLASRSVPEPSTLGLLGAVVAAAAWSWRKSPRAH